MSFPHINIENVKIQFCPMENQNEILAAAPPRHSLWKALNDAIRGTDADYTKIDIKKAIFLLAVPMILELVMESTFTVVDIYFVGQLGASAVATVGLTETYLFLLYSVAMGLYMAVTAIIARRTGEKNKEKAERSAIQPADAQCLNIIARHKDRFYFSRR